jgi:intraflagellar transport protein 172
MFYHSSIASTTNSKQTTCIHLNNLQILEPLELTPEAGAMWQQLSDVALQHGDVIIAERCATALGDVPRAAYLHAINATVSAIDKENNSSDGSSRSKDHWSVRYKMCLLRKDMRGAEDVLMSQGKLQEAIDMYHKVCVYTAAV